MNDQYEINNLDIFTTWGMVFQQGAIDQLMRLPARKARYEYSWPDEDGTERDVTNPIYETRELEISAMITGSSPADFITKYDAFKAYIVAAGYFNLDCIAMNKRWKLLYKASPGYRQLDLQSARFTLVLLDDYPNETFAID